MNSRILVDRCKYGIIVGIASLALAGTALAQPGQSTSTRTITVFAERYAVGPVAFNDIDLLQRHIAGTGARDVELVVCEATATRALKAAVHRFRHMPVTMRVSDMRQSECMSKQVPLVIPASDRRGPRPFGIDDQAVERYWSEMMP